MTTQSLNTTNIPINKTIVYKTDNTSTPMAYRTTDDATFIPLDNEVYIDPAIYTDIDLNNLNQYDVINSQLVMATAEELARRNTAQLDMWKRIKLKEMDNYPYINRGAYTINGESVYFDKAQRTAFIIDIDANIANGTNTVWLWLNDTIIKVTCNDLRELVYKLNDFSQRCFNMMCNIKAAIRSESNLETLKTMNNEDWLPVNATFTIKTT